MRSDEPHAVTRLRERYGIEASEADLRDLEHTARETGILMRSLERGRTLHMVRWRDITMQVVLSQQGYVVTLLPPENKRKRPTRANLRNPRSRSERNRGKRQYARGMKV